MKIVSLAALAALSAAAAFPAFASTNLGFEDGLTGWTVDGVAPTTENGGAVDVVGSADDYYQTTTYGPTEGDSFARLIAGFNAQTYTTLSHDFAFAAQSVLSFDVAFLAFDEANYNDDGFVQILGPNGGYLFQSSVSAVGDYGSSGWKHIRVVLGPGSYTLQAGIRNMTPDPDVFFDDFGADSQLLLDNVAVAVPEPESWALLILGFAGLGAALRTRRAGLARAV